MSSDSSSVITMQQVILPEVSGPAVHFDLQAGESLAVIGGDQELYILQLILSGAVKPVSGEVTWFGMSAPLLRDRAFEKRVAWTFSPLFGFACWLENLNIDENVYLASSMHGGRLWRIREEAEKLAQSFYLNELPRRRRSQVTAAELCVYQWVRAFLHHDAKLFVMIDPVRGASEEACDRLLDHVKNAQRDGASFLWLLSKQDDAFLKELQKKTKLNVRVL